MSAKFKKSDVLSFTIETAPGTYIDLSSALLGCSLEYQDDEIVEYETLSDETKEELEKICVTEFKDREAKYINVFRNQ